MTADNALTADAETHTERFTRELGDWLRERLPQTLTNAEYAAASSGMMIALNRQLAACAAAFGEVHEVHPVQVRALVVGQFDKNHARAIAVLREGPLQ